MALFWLIAFTLVFTAAYGYLKHANARARERAGLPPRVRVKLPLYWWALFIFLLCINTAYFFSHPHVAP